MNLNLVFLLCPFRLNVVPENVQQQKELENLSQNCLSLALRKLSLRILCVSGVHMFTDVGYFLFKKVIVTCGCHGF